MALRSPKHHNQCILSIRKATEDGLGVCFQWPAKSAMAFAWATLRTVNVQADWASPSRPRRNPRAAILTFWAAWADSAVAVLSLGFRVVFVSLLDWLKAEPSLAQAAAGRRWRLGAVCDARVGQPDCLSA